MSALTVRQMTLDETRLRIDYFLNASPDFLALLGVDPGKLPSREAWFQSFAEDRQRPIEARGAVHLVWLRDDVPVGMSSADNIVFGDSATMHLHIFAAADRGCGVGVDGVRQSAALYFRLLRLKRLFCRPNAFNTAPNRTLQRAGFRYVSTEMTTPGPINLPQAVTTWELTRPD